MTLRIQGLMNVMGARLYRKMYQEAGGRLSWKYP
jgi:hypothetical protein